eukprot:TRINITY_DN6629_c0_g1_i1.p1 TRINITY_DN6629_c0_g1~~TRINITY_DN6629_c0_g1_i1.p1  ORF type:complete len:675 (-),score=110.99 TRINITY_DN6629_c0_g1_i1:21-2045(-)
MDTDDLRFRVLSEKDPHKLIRWAEELLKNKPQEKALLPQWRSQIPWNDKQHNDFKAWLYRATMYTSTAYDRLVGNIFKGDSKKDIDYYIQENNIFNIKEVSKRHKCTPLTAAILSGNEEVAKYLIKKGALVNDKTQKGVPMLFVAADRSTRQKSEKAILSSGPLFKLLLKKGADPNATNSEGKMVDQLPESPLSNTMWYWLQRARDVEIHKKELRDNWEKRKALGLTELYFSLVGQRIGVESVITSIFGKLSDPNREKKPIVLMLVGPAGHGKTSLAEYVIDALCPSTSDSVRVNFGTIVDGKWGIFGSDPGYVGTGNATTVTDFMSKHDGKFGVVVFEEFEKVGDSAREALLHPFESGEWENKSGGKPFYDCSRIVFLLTSNLMNEELCQKLDEEGLLQDYFQATDKDLQYQLLNIITEKVNIIIKEKLKLMKPPEFARRIEAVPFITLSEVEKKIVVEEFIESLQTRYIHPPEGERHIGNINMYFNDNVVGFVVSKYDPSEGASIMKRTLTRVIDSAAIAISKKHSDKIWFYVKKEALTFGFQEPTEEDLKKSSLSTSTSVSSPTTTSITTSTGSSISSPTTSSITTPTSSLDSPYSNDLMASFSFMGSGQNNNNFQFGPPQQPTSFPMMSNTNPLLSFPVDPPSSGILGGSQIISSTHDSDDEEDIKIPEV